MLEWKKPMNADIEGIYSVQNGQGFMVLDTGKLIGIDETFAYSGNYVIKKDRMFLSFTRREHGLPITRDVDPGSRQEPLGYETVVVEFDERVGLTGVAWAASGLPWQQMQKLDR
jgi:hypothetical protein